MFETPQLSISSQNNIALTYIVPQGTERLHKLQHFLVYQNFGINAVLVKIHEGSSTGCWTISWSYKSSRLWIEWFVKANAIKKVSYCKFEEWLYRKLCTGFENMRGWRPLSLHMKTNEQVLDLSHIYSPLEFFERLYSRIWECNNHWAIKIRIQREKHQVKPEWYRTY